MVVYLKCPLCGKLAHMSCFNPEEYSDDIECVEMRGLGRGRGFEVTSRFSALGDEELMDMISARCHIILRLAGEEVTEKSAATALEKELGEWRKEALGRREVENQLRDRIVGLQGSVDEYKDEVEAWRAESEDLISRVNAAFNEDYEDLDDAVDFLLEVALEE